MNKINRKASHHFFFGLLLFFNDDTNEFKLILNLIKKILIIFLESIFIWETLKYI